MRRREFFGGVLSATAALGVTAPSDGAEAALATDPALEPDETLGNEQLLALLAPLELGQVVGLGWRLAELTDVVKGGAVLTLYHDESAREARVHVCRKGEVARGAAQSETLDFLLMNDGDGSRPTDESLGRVLRVIALVARGNEGSGLSAPRGLLSHDARVSAFRRSRALV
ncbi:MAG: hypothetical protein KF718_17165 [Polyangiaceae bacterium]|nr:hypothetical protein [Polyangiaceae bacterium]